MDVEVWRERGSYFVRAGVGEAAVVYRFRWARQARYFAAVFQFAPPSALPDPERLQAALRKRRATTGHLSAPRRSPQATAESITEALAAHSVAAGMAHDPAPAAAAQPF